MIPEGLSGSYERYKTDTNVFTTWLAQTAAACGYTPKKARASAPTPKPSATQQPGESADNVTGQTLAEKLRAKAEKKAEKNARKKEEKKNPASQLPQEALPIEKHLLTTRDLLQQAEAVSRNKKVIVPDTIVHVLDRAIEARKRCAAWFEKTGLEKESTEKHIHFVGILEKTLKILRPDYSPRNTASSEDNAVDDGRSKPEKNSPSHDFSGLSNRFSSLDVEDVEDVLEAAATSTTDPKPTSKNAGPKPSTSIDVFELQYDGLFDRMFVVYCFFEDLHRMQDFLHGTWTKYKEGKCDLITASITTTIAFDLVRRQEQNLSRDLFDSDRFDYFGLVDIIFFRNLLKGNDGTRENHWRITSFDSFVFLSTARSIQKFELVMGHAYPPPVLPFFATYKLNEDMRSIPEVSRMEREDKFVNQYLMDLVFYYSYEEVMRVRDGELPKSEKQEHLHKDVFTRGLEEMQLRETSTWMVFACRILTDLQEILGDKVKQGWTLLRQTAQTSSAKINMRILGTPGSEVEDGGWAQDRWHSSQIDILMRIHRKGGLCLIGDEHDMFQKVKKRRLEEKDRLPPKYYQSYNEVLEDRLGWAEKIVTNWVELEMIRPSEKESFIYTSNPIFCGFKMFEIASDVERAGTVLESYNHSIFNIAHLYNAALQTGILKSRWPEMDFFIQCHMNTLFAGQLPENRDDILISRYITQFGMSPKFYARHRRTNIVPRGKEIYRPGFKNGPTIRNSKANDIFQDYFANDVPKSIEKCLYELTALTADENKTQTRALRQSYPTPVQLLLRAQSSVPALIQQMQIDYISLNPTCTKLLGEIRERLRTERGIKLAENSFEGKLVGLPFGILGDEAELNSLLGKYSNKKYQKALDKIPGGPQLREGGPQVRIVSKVLGDFIENLTGIGGSKEKELSEPSEPSERLERPHIGEPVKEEEKEANKVKVAAARTNTTKK